MKKVASSFLTGLLAGGALAVMVALMGPATAAHAATVPIDLYAVTGTTNLGTQTVNVWGYNITGATATQPGGPTLIVNSGDEVTVTLHNGLTEATALLFQGQNMIPDRTGVAAGADNAAQPYTFTASQPGTYLYEAGLVPNAQHQVAMGLYGALIVRPALAPGQAYDSVATAFDSEAALVLSEIDPALNNAASPAAFDMRKYAPRYFLINGKAYPTADPIAATASSKVLLRYVNAGIQYHSMAVLGAEQRVIALDGSPLSFSRGYAAETFGPGQTTDVLVTAPAATADQNRLAIYDGSLLLHNSNIAGSGGMLTFLSVPGTPTITDNTGPVTSSVAYSGGNLTATVNDAATGSSNIAAAEYFIDTVGAPGSGTSMAATDGTFDTVSEGVTVAVTIPPGQHILYVRGLDSAAPTNWGVFSSVLVSGGDATGPTTKSPTLTPSPTNGAVSVAVHATGDDTATGGSSIAAAEFTIDGVCPATQVPDCSMTVNLAAPIASLDATINVATMSALAEGTHAVSIHSQDAASPSWGAPVAIDLTIDKTAPATSGVAIDPPHNNGTLAFNSSTQTVRLTATLSDPLGAGVNSNISAAEAFIDSVGTFGTGIVIRPVDGTFNTPSEAGYADIPLATVAQLPVGTHTIYVHAKDAAGNWGLTATTTLVIDKTRPSVSGVSATPNPTLGATSVTLSATATDAASDVNRAEWFTGADPGVGNASPMTVTGPTPWSLSASIDVSSWAEGAYTLNVRARDAAGNWSLTSSTVLTVSTPLYFSTLGSTTVPGVGGTADDADIYNWSGTAYSRVIDASAAPYNLPGNANVDGFDRVSATQFYLSFNGQVNVPGIGNVQDEDVVFFNGTSWSLFFDGSVRGLSGASATDLDAISIVGGQLYFSTDNAAIPPGAGGAGDDADIYLWNGASSYTRVVDASGAGSLLGLPAAANVDGFVRVDATHFYLSFSADTTVPVLGLVQDEDVVYYKNGIWSVYFNGTAHGLTAANLDVDAFDVP